MATLPLLAIAPGASASFDDPLANLNTGGRTYLSGTFNTRAPVANAPAAQVAAPASDTPAADAPAAQTAPAKKTYQPMQSDNGSFIKADGSRFLSAKDIRYDKPGSVAQFYEWTGDQAREMLGKLYGERNQKAGGSAKIYGAASKYAARYFDSGPAGAFSSGDFSGLSDQAALDALDAGYREQGRQQQNKSGFLDSVLGKVIGVGATIAASIVGGPAAGAFVGGAIPAATGGDFADIALGAVGGYGIGKGVEFVQGGGVGRLVASAKGVIPGATPVWGFTPANVASFAKVPGLGLADSILGPAANVAAGASLFDRGAQAAQVVNAGVNVRSMLTGAGTAAVALAAGNALLPSATPAPALPTPAPAAPDNTQTEVDRLRRRRAATKTVYTWGQPMMGTVSSPSLSGGLLEAKR